jgi:hypothetical protein
MRWSERTRCLQIALHRHFEAFLRERTYIENVSPRMLAWYRTAFQG